MNVRVILLVGIAAFAGVSWILSFQAQKLQTLNERVGVTDLRSFETLTVVTAGTGAAQEDPARLGPLIAVGAGERMVAVDAGRAAAEALRGSKIPLTQPDTIFLTSLLPENVVGLGELLFAGWAAGRAVPLRVVGPPGTKALVEGLAAAYAAPVDTLATGIGLPAEGGRFEALEVGDGWREERGGITTQAALLPGGPFPALAWRFESGGRSAVVNGAGFGSDALVALASGVDLLVQEALHTPTIESAAQTAGEEGARIAREAAWHTQAAAAGEVAARAGAHTLVLVRLRPPPLHDRQYVSLVRERFAGPVVLASDADEITR